MSNGENFIEEYSKKVIESSLKEDLKKKFGKFTVAYYQHLGKYKYYIDYWGDIVYSETTNAEYEAKEFVKKFNSENSIKNFLDKKNIDYEESYKESFKVGQTVKTASSGYGIIKKVRYNEPALPNEYYVQTKHDSFWADENDLKKESYKESLKETKYQVGNKVLANFPDDNETDVVTILGYNSSQRVYRIKFKDGTTSVIEPEDIIKKESCKESLKEEYTKEDDLDDRALAKFKKPYEELTNEQKKIIDAEYKKVNKEGLDEDSKKELYSQKMDYCSNCRKNTIHLIKKKVPAGGTGGELECKVCGNQRLDKIQGFNAELM